MLSWRTFTLFFCGLTFCCVTLSKDQPHGVFQIKQWTYKQNSSTDPAVEIFFGGDKKSEMPLNYFHLRSVFLDPETNALIEFSSRLPALNLTVTMRSISVPFPELMSRSSGSLAIVHNDSPSGVMAISHLEDFVIWGSAHKMNYLLAAAESKGFVNKHQFLPELSEGQSYLWNQTISERSSIILKKRYQIERASFGATQGDFPTQCDIYGEKNSLTSGGGYSACRLTHDTRSQFCTTTSNSSRIDLTYSQTFSMRLSFSFLFFGREYNMVTVGGSGYMQFGSTNEQAAFECPLGAGLSSVFAMFLSDFNPPHQRRVFFGEVISPNGNPMFVVSFSSPSSRDSFVAGLESGTNNLFVCINQGDQGTIGIRNATFSLNAGDCTDSKNKGKTFLFQVGEQDATSNSEGLSPSAIIGIFFLVICYVIYCCCPFTGITALFLANIIAACFNTSQRHPTSSSSTYHPLPTRKTQYRAELPDLTLPPSSPIQQPPCAPQSAPSYSTAAQKKAPSHSTQDLSLTSQPVRFLKAPQNPPQKPSQTRKNLNLIEDVDCNNVPKKPMNQQPLPSRFIKVLPASSWKYANIYRYFHTRWLKKESGRPEIINIFSIIQSVRIRQRFENRREEIREEAPELNEGNTLQQFHGPGRQMCSLGASSNDIWTCKNLDCSTCGIITKGFLLALSKKNTAWARFGNGLYFTDTSSKANDYNEKTSIGLGEGYRAMLLCEVICGKPERLTENDPKRTGPEEGFHSVHGQASRKGPLNYGERVVYSEDQVKVVNLIIYRLWQ